ncbi:MAG TPA: helix-turn-helix transcriptional regulator [Acidimicrobiales bacterium]|nr:helix-turn-helix transcriptional regulator [Acidimicrobiales bacterium]
MSISRPHPAVAEFRRRGITVTQAAADLGLARPYLSSVLHGRRSASSALRQRIADYLSIPTEDLFVEELIVDEQSIVDLASRLAARTFGPGQRRIAVVMVETAPAS